MATSSKGAAHDSKPVQLQLNNSGAWKTIARFDASNDASADKARAAGQLLGELGGGARTTLRIATDEPMPCVLVRWDADRGWWDVAAATQDRKVEQTLLPDIEAVADQVHQAWIETKLAQGITTRPAATGEEQMVPYAQLTEPLKELDRSTVRAVYAAIKLAASGREATL